MRASKGGGIYLAAFQWNCLKIALGTRLIDHMSNSKLYEKFSLSPLPSAKTNKKKIKMTKSRLTDGLLPKNHKRFNVKRRFIGSCKE